MDNLIIDETKYTPKIVLDSDTGIFDISGKSYPENTFEFYKPMMDWIEKYFETQAKEKTVFNINILYFNSSSSKLLFDLFDYIDEQASKGTDVEINWLYDNEDETSLEAGEDFKEDFENLNINLVEK